MTREISLAEVESLVRGGAGYALLDPAGRPELCSKLERMGTVTASALYAGTLFADYTAVSPYLVRMDAELLHWLREEAWGEPWGVFVFSRLEQSALFEHFQRFLSIVSGDGTVAFFRFFDPRVLEAFLESEAAARVGFWSGVSAYGWSEEESVRIVSRPSDSGDVPLTQRGVALTAELEELLKWGQIRDFTRRCRSYFEVMALALPGEATEVLSSLFRYAISIGISVELDLVRFATLMVGCKGLLNVVSLRELLTYPDLDGGTKVDLLCEAAAFGSAEDYGEDAARGLDGVAAEEATEALLAGHTGDAEFMRAHLGGKPLTLDSWDARWRREWLVLYKAAVSRRSGATDVVLGSVQVSAGSVTD